MGSHECRDSQLSHGLGIQLRHCGCSALCETSLSTPSPQGLGNRKDHGRRGGRTYKLAGVENCEILSSGDDTPIALRNRQPLCYLHKTHTRSGQSKFKCEELWLLMTTWKGRIIFFPLGVWPLVGFPHSCGWSHTHPHTDSIP